MTGTKAICIQPHILLCPNTVNWDITREKQPVTSFIQKYSEPATKPPLRSMVFMIPGFPHHLQPLEVANADSTFITVAQVFEYIYRHLCVYDLASLGFLANVSGQQMMHASRNCEVRERMAGYEGPTDPIQYANRVRGINFCYGRTKFGGVIHQTEVNGANVFVVVLKKEDQEPNYADGVFVNLHPGYLVWDLNQLPTEGQREVIVKQVFNKTLGIMSSDNLQVGPQIVLSDLSGGFVLNIATKTTERGNVGLTMGEVLDCIYHAMNAKYSDSHWPCWSKIAATMAKKSFASTWWARSEMSPQDELSNYTFLDTIPFNHRRFLGIWHIGAVNGVQTYALLLQPSSRTVPVLHAALVPHGVNWNITMDPCDISDESHKQPALFPSRQSMSLVIEFAPGESWRLEIYREEDSGYVTVSQVLSAIYEYLVIEVFQFRWDLLPMNLHDEIWRRAKGRGVGRDDIFGIRRVDTLRQTAFIGLEHRISVLGEDEWKVLFGNGSPPV